MTGIFLLLIAMLWIVMLIFLSRVIVKKWIKFKSPLWGFVVGFAIFAILLPLPLIDEIIGGWQFKKLCHEKAKVIIDAKNTNGRTIWFENTQRATIVLNGIRVMQSKRNYVDVETQEPIYHYYLLEAKGGWFVHTFGISEGHVPLLFEATCQPEDIKKIDIQLGIKRINRPNSK